MPADRASCCRERPGQSAWWCAAGAQHSAWSDPPDGGTGGGAVLQAVSSRLHGPAPPVAGEGRPVVRDLCRVDGGPRPRLCVVRGFHGRMSVRVEGLAPTGEAARVEPSVPDGNGSIASHSRTLLVVKYVRFQAAYGVSRRVRIGSVEILR